MRIFLIVLWPLFGLGHYRSLWVPDGMIHEHKDERAVLHALGSKGLTRSNPILSKREYPPAGATNWHLEQNAH